MTLSIGDTISRTFGVYGRNIGPLFLAAIIALAPATFYGMYGPLSSPIIFEADPVGGFTAMLWSYLLLQLGSAFVIAVAVAASEGVEDTGSLFSQSARRFVPVAVVFMLFTAAVTVGAFLLVIPGIVAAVWFSAAMTAAAAERPGIFGAFGRSIALVRGNAWPVLGFGIFMVGVSIAASWVSGRLVGALSATAEPVIGSAVAHLIQSFVIPITAAGWAALYTGLRLAEPRPAAVDGLEVEPVPDDELPSDVPHGRDTSGGSQPGSEG